MKTFHRESGHQAGETVTVGELLALLARYPSDMPVFAQWEGCDGYIHPDNFEVTEVSKGLEIERCLVIDVNAY